jgi:hypothetical protein
MDIKHKFYTIDEMVCFLHTHAGHVYAMHAYAMLVHSAHAYAAHTDVMHPHDVHCMLYTIINSNMQSFAARPKLV